jgi:hypothetical protein
MLTAHILKKFGQNMSELVRFFQCLSHWLILNLCDCLLAIFTTIFTSTKTGMSELWCYSTMSRLVNHIALFKPISRSLISGSVYFESLMKPVTIR